MYTMTKDGLFIFDQRSLAELIRRVQAPKDKIEAEDRAANQAKLRALGVGCRCAGTNVPCEHPWPTLSKEIT